MEWKMDCVTFSTTTKIEVQKQAQSQATKFIPVTPKIEVGFVNYYRQLERRTGRKYPRLTKTA